jgi:DNA polymerase III epsilon subunit-like protein
MTLAFLDTETTGLADDCDIWEIGLITRDPRPADVDDAIGDMADHIDTEYRWLIRPDLTTAEPTGLRIGRYYQRIGSLSTYPPGEGKAMTHPDHDKRSIVTAGLHIAAEVAQLLDGATIVGAVPDFDARHLTRWLRANGQAATHHYHLCDVETFAAGALGLPPPWNLDTLLDRYGLKYDEADRHTALGDARMVRDLYDAVLSGRKVDG